jgi:hypothetical protein
MAAPVRNILENPRMHAPELEADIQNFYGNRRQSAFDFATNGIPPTKEKALSIHYSRLREALFPLKIPAMRSIALRMF